MDKGLYYYNTYENHRITVVDMHKEDLDGKKIVTYPLRTGESFFGENCASGTSDTMEPFMGNR